MPSAAIPGGLAQWQQYLEGTWSNQTLPNATNDEGSTSNPLGYNVMPLPQKTAQDGANYGYILKNFTLYERLTFNGPSGASKVKVGPPPSTAPNRGDDSAQLPTAIFYQQEVFFGKDSGAEGAVTHTENGTWLNLATGPAMIGPYGAPILDPDNKQPVNRQVAKQMSVPHGNSVLALGSVEVKAGKPHIAELNAAPSDPRVDTELYGQTLTSEGNYQNPKPSWSKNPNVPVKMGVELIEPTDYYHLSVATPKQSSDSLNIPFEKRVAKVTSYTADYWLMSNDDGKSYNYLAYSQTTNMEMKIGDNVIEFPHVTSNVLTRVMS